MVYFGGLNKGLWIPVIVNFALLLTYFSILQDFLTGFILLSNIFWGFFGKDLLIQKYLEKNYYPKHSKCFLKRESTINLSKKKKKMKLVSIIDYGCGNIRSVFNAFNAISEKKNIKVLVTTKKKKLKNQITLYFLE